MKNFKLLILSIISIVLLSVITPAKAPPDIIIQPCLDNISKAIPAVILQTVIKTDTSQTALSVTNDWLIENKSANRANKTKFEFDNAHKLKPTNTFNRKPAIVRLE